jgi:hypothetical protein
MNRSFRRLAACLSMAAFAFAQLAISAYACPKGAEPQAPVEAVAEHESACPELDNSNLCERHCDYGSATVATHADSVAPPDLALLPWRLAPVLQESVRVRPLAGPLGSIAPPPRAAPTPLRI